MPVGCVPWGAQATAAQQPGRTLVAVIWLVTGGGLGGGLFLVGALATAIGFVVHGVMETSRPRHGR